uniref:Uncharacterized protein n=1 Tax=Anguilla anguilla TaxID=7936 RepID=A0A0E9SWB0_ANGAN
MMRLPSRFISTKVADLLRGDFQKFSGQLGLEQHGRFVLHGEVQKGCRHRWRLRVCLGAWGHFYCCPAPPHTPHQI